MTDEVSGAVPLLTVTRGVPTPDELAAVLVVLASLPAGQAASGGAGRASWSAKSRMLRVPVRPGPGGWRASALPA